MKPDEPHWDSHGKGDLDGIPNVQGLMRILHRYSWREQISSFHHENELAQAACVYTPFANVWVHNGFVTIDNENVQIIGNFFTLRDIFNDHSPDAFAFFYAYALSCPTSYQRMPIGRHCGI